MTDQISLLKLLDCIDGMLTERYGAEQASRMLNSLGLSRVEISAIEHVTAFQLDRIMALTEEAEAAQGKHLAHFDVGALIDLAYENGHIDRDTAMSMLIGDGANAASAVHHCDTVDAIRDRNASRAEYLDHPDTAWRYCTLCGRRVTAESLSRRGICDLCRGAITDAHTKQMAEKAGPYYRAWRNAMLRSLYRLEDEEIAERRADPDPLATRPLSDYIEPGHHECNANCYHCAVEMCSLRIEPYEGAAEDVPEDDWFVEDGYVGEHDDTYEGETGDYGNAENQT
ncbi:MAG: hypothetical protein KJ604_20785 [Gammaproteobacteria bacterium]|nr:hypothetical protein [Gammaproteobacteria bacterium]